MPRLSPHLQERCRILESVGFVYRPSQSIFVQPDLKQVLTADFVEAAHRDDLERAVRAQHDCWVIHSIRPIPGGDATAILRTAASLRAQKREEPRSDRTWPGREPRRRVP